MGDGQADFINALTDPNPPGRGHAFPERRESQPCNANWGRAGSSTPAVDGAAPLGSFG